MSFLYRCTHCGKRSALKKLHNFYAISPKCTVCNYLLTYRDVWQERKNKDKKNLCYCDGIHFAPHRKASTVWCHEHKVGPSDDDYKRRYGDYENG